METSIHLQQFIEHLALTYQFDVTVPGRQLLLALPGSCHRLLISGLIDQRVSVTHCLADAEEGLRCDTDMVFLITPLGWEPVEFVHSDAVWQAYTCAVQITHDEAGNVLMSNFAEYWAKQLHAQGWLTQGYQPNGTITNYHQAADSALRQYVEKLATHHGIDLTSFAAYLWLDLPRTDKTLFVTKTDGYLIHLVYGHTEEEDYLIPQMTIDCVITTTGAWHPIKIDGSALTVEQDTQETEALYNSLMVGLAQQLKVEEWLAQSYLVFGDWKQC